MISFTLDGNSIETAPSKGAYDVSVTCDKGATGYWDYEGWGPYIQNITENKTKCTINFKNGKYFSDYVMALSNTNPNVVKIEHEATEQTPALTDYRYSGANKDVNNYVCFGSEASPCPSDNLYRIIGVMPTQSSASGEYENRVKLIKATNWVGSTPDGNVFNNEKNGKGYYWYMGNVNTYKTDWSTSSLKGVLNGEYYNSLGEYQKYIEQANWYLGVLNNTKLQSYKVSELYQLERALPTGAAYPLNFVSNIGLMYPSDYGYSLKGGTNNEKWNKQAQYSNKEEYVANAWLDNNNYSEWTINSERGYSAGDRAIAIQSGYLTFPRVYVVYDISAVRPTFYLKADVKYASGDGTIDNPYRIK